MPPIEADPVLLLKEAYDVAIGARPPSEPYCVEWDRSLCGRPATHVTLDPITGTWGPKCDKCRRYYANDWVKKMPSNIARDIGHKQLILRLADALSAALKKDQDAAH
jgi:hypothetical protein